MLIGERTMNGTVGAKGRQIGMGYTARFSTDFWNLYTNGRFSALGRYSSHTLWSHSLKISA